jgi:integrase/recombinase XerD
MISQKSRSPFKLFSENEVAALLRNTNNLKHRCILTLVYATGIRATELSQLKLADVDVQQSLLLIRGTKGNQTRVVIVVPRAMYLIRQYFLKYQPLKYMFENPDGEKYSVASFQQVFKRAVERSKLDKNITLNSLRVSLVTNLKHRGKRVRHIGELTKFEHIVTEPDIRKQYLEKLNRSLGNFDLWKT